MTGFHDNGTNLCETITGALSNIIGCCQQLQQAARSRGAGTMLEPLSRIEGSSRQVIELLQQRCAGPLVEEKASYSLLVVEAESTNRALLGGFLAEQGFEVCIASDEAVALELAGRRDFDLILLDLLTPPDGGLKVLERLRRWRNQEELPVFLLCSADARDKAVVGLRHGANDYLTRPIELQAARARIQTQLSLKNVRRQLGQLRRSLESTRSRVTRLASSSFSALEDIGGWCSAVVNEVREATSARKLAVFSLAEKGNPAVVAGDDDVAAPTEAQLVELEKCQPFEHHGAALLPVCGYSGKLVGALILSPAGVLRSEEASELLASFSAHLGGVLEMHRLRRQLAVSTERRRLSRLEMINRGVDVLQVCPECGRCYDHRSKHCSEDQTPLTTPRRPLPYRIDGRYRLTWLLGKGGMGTVFRGRDEKLGRDIAIKILQARFFGDERMCLRFENEARALARISHSGVIGVHDSGFLEDGSRYIVMELLVGCTLKALMRAHGRATPAQAAALLRQGANALQAAHAAGVIHRDIKPENVFVLGTARELTFKLLDFGIAKELSVGADLTCTGDLVGTPRYMAPEQLIGGTVDARGDLYSFAAVVYEALIGRPLVNASNLARVLLETFRRTPPAVSTLLPNAPLEVDRAFRRAFSRRPEQRPPRVVEWVESFVDQLEQMAPSCPGWPDDIASAIAHTESETQLDFIGPPMIERTGPTADLHVPRMSYRRLVQTLGK